MPQDDFTEWLKNVLTIDTTNPYEHDDAKFVSDVLEYQLDDEVVPPGTPLQRNARSEVNQHPPESYRTPPWHSKNAKTAPAATTLFVPVGWTIENGYYYTPMNNYKLTEMQAHCFLDVSERGDLAKRMQCS